MTTTHNVQYVYKQNTQRLCFLKGINTVVGHGCQDTAFLNVIFSKMEDSIYLVQTMNRTAPEEDPIEQIPIGRTGL